MTMRPLRNLVLVERMRERASPGGILFPRAFKRKHPSEKHKYVPDYWRARVKAVGPDVQGLSDGDEVLIYTWSENGKGQLHMGLYTGIPVGKGDDEVLVEYPDDIICAIAPGVTIGDRAHDLLSEAGTLRLVGDGAKAGWGQA